MPEITIRVAETTEDRAAVCRFRYEVYVEELGWRQDYADHARRTIDEPLDRTGVVIGAFARDTVVGTVRKNFGATCDLGYYPGLCEMARFAGDAYPSSVSMTTKMIVAKSYRGTFLPTRLGIETYRLTYDRGAVIDFITFDVSLTHLERYYSGIGYIEYREPAEHPEFGRSRMMLCRTNDLQHFVNIRSPYADVCRECLGLRACSPQEKYPSITHHSI